jgi:hypothetical protein
MHGSARCLPPLAAVALVALFVAPGCTRHDFRERADRDVEAVITEKNIFPEWQLKNWHVYPDPRARYADTSNPDRPPMPPDDFAVRLTSPNSQRPTKNSGVGRVDGTGYLAVLQKYDAENRAEGPSRPGETSDPLGTPPAPAQVTTEHPSPWKGAPAIAAPTLLVGDRPAVRHTVPPGTPAALRPASGPTLAQEQQPSAVPAPQPPVIPSVVAAEQPAAVPVARPAATGEFGPWVGTKPSMPGPVVSTGPDGAPVISELRPPVVVMAVGEVERNGQPVPAVAVIPVEGQPAAQPEKQPDKVPDKAPEKLPQPQPVPGPMTFDLPPIDPNYPVPVQPGETAKDFLTVLDSKQVPYRLKMDQAVLFTFLNAREIQDRREDLYNTALDVTLSRFSFAAQGAVTEQVLRQSIGSQLTGAGQFWNANTTASVSKLFPAGATLMAQLANQVVIDLGHGQPTVAVSNLSLSLMQPFLSGGGYAANLETLNQNERNLLYALRSFMRFRRLVYASVTASNPNGYTNNPYGLQGLALNLGRGIGNNLTSPSVGFLPLLSLQSIILNQKKNVATLERLLRLYAAYREGGQYSDLQLGQVEVQLLNSRSALLGSANSTNNSTSGIRGYLDTLDNYKLQLGLPLTTPLELDDAPIRPINRQLGRIEEVYAHVQAVEVAAAKFDRAEPVAAFRQRWLALFTTSQLAQGTPFAKRIEERWRSWSPERLTEPQVRDRLAALRAQRQKLLDARAERELKKLPDPPAELAQLSVLDAEIDLGDFERAVRAYEAQPWARMTGRERDLTQSSAFSAAYNSFYQVVLEARNDRLNLLFRSWPKLPDLQVLDTDVLTSSLDEGYTAALQTALSKRLDLMNARAQAVDGWRELAVTANALQGVFNVGYNLTSSSPLNGNQPFNFSGPRSTNQLVINMQLPLVRRAERNAYRSALIDYQRARRNVMAFEDNIANDVRGDVRELRTLAQLYKIQLRVLEVQYAQVDNATALLLAPPAPLAPRTIATTDQVAAAALTNQVLGAQANLVIAQNTLYQLWIAFITSRMTFYLDLELMQLDDRGVWTDEFTNRIQYDDRPDARQPANQPAGQPPRPAGERLPAPQRIDGNGR